MASHGLLKIVDFKLSLLATLVFVLVIGCSNGSDEESSVTAVSVEPTVSATEGSGNEPDPEILTVDDLLASIERAVEGIRGIDAPPPVEHRFVDQAGMQERLDEELTDPEVLEQIEHEETLFKLLGVIPQDADLNAIYESMFGSQVLGLYDPEKEEFFVLGDDQSGAESIDVEAQLTYAHEYVHRLQDAKFDLEKMKDLATGDDMSLAISALIEGDATSAQSQYMLANYDFSELSELLESALASQAELPESPYFLQRSLEFSYTDGAAFIAVILQLGGFAAVDAVFVDPPKSTEQILHPEKYLDQELPIELDFPDDGHFVRWNIQTENVMGEFFLGTWLEALGSDSANAAAAGWAGDVYAVVENGNGETGFVATIGWDTSDDAEEFFTALTDAMAANDEYSSLGTGIPGVIESWKVPVGNLVMSRWVAEDDKYRVVIGIGSSVGIAQELQLAGAYEFTGETELAVLD